MEVLSAGERGGQGYVPIRNEDKPLPRAGEEGVVVIVLTEDRETSVDHLSPRGLVGFRWPWRLVRAVLEATLGIWGAPESARGYRSNQKVPDRGLCI